MPATATVCPHCGYDYRPPPPKTKRQLAAEKGLLTKALNARAKALAKS